MRSDLSDYYDPMDPGFPDRGTEADVNAYLLQRKAKGLLNPTAALKRIQQLEASPRARSIGKSFPNHPLVEELNHITQLCEFNKLKLRVAELEDIIQRAKAASELVTVKGKAMVAVPYWFIKS